MLKFLRATKSHLACSSAGSCVKKLARVLWRACNRLVHLVFWLLTAELRPQAAQDAFALDVASSLGLYIPVSRRAVALVPLRQAWCIYPNSRSESVSFRTDFQDVGDKDSDRAY